MDPEFGFKADDLLITWVVASLAYQHIEHGQSIISLNEVSNAIYFIQYGQVEVSYKNDDHILLLYENGSYIGDTSLIYGIRN